MHEVDRLIEDVLTHDETIETSPGFAGQVMAEVRRSAALPPPIAFPWRLALAGAGVCLLLTVAAAAVVFTAPLPAPPPAVQLTMPDWTDWPSWIGAGQLGDAAGMSGWAGQAGWAACAVAGSFLLTSLARRLTRT